jgi:hypothetical protein
VLLQDVGVNLFFSTAGHGGGCGSMLLQLNVLCDDAMETLGSPSLLQPLNLSSSEVSALDGGGGGGSCQLFGRWRTRCIPLPAPDPDSITDNVGRLGWWLLPICLLFVGLFAAGLVVAVRRRRAIRGGGSSDGSLASSLLDGGDRGSVQQVDSAAASAAANDSAEFMR